MKGRIASIHRYPVKGFSPESLAEVTLKPKAVLPGDRLYAVENGPSGFDPEAPAYQPKSKFLCLMKNARLATLATTFDVETHDWHIAGPTPLMARLSTAEGRAAAEAYLTAFMGEERRGPLRVLTAPPHAFTDVGKPFVSLINLATVAALSLEMGRTIDPMRFRANIYLEGLPPFVELDWVGASVQLGGAEAKIVKRTQRCVATNVDPATGQRDMEIPAFLLRHHDHMDCGVYAEIRRGAIIAPGEAFTLG